MTQVEWRRVWEVFSSASGLPPAERQVFLESSLPEGPLRDKVWELLSERDDSDPALDDPGPRDPASTTAFPLVGRSMGRFQLLSAIGRGGMGEVYRAFDPELQREVAVKCVASSDLGSTNAIADSLREARAASALNHPGIVTVFEVIRDGNTVAIVMELVEGRSLRALTGAPQPLALVSLWGQRIAEALAATHARGILHRDIKPENLILRDDGYVKVLDFGLAAEGPFERSELPVGTVRYMSPEQARGTASLTPATDIFSLGVVLYELATGTHPFAPQGRDNTTLTVAAALARVVVRSPSTIVPSLPREFDCLIVGMLDKDPARRPTAEAVAATLGTLPNAALRRRRVVLSVLLAAGAVLAIIGLLTVFKTDPEPTAVVGTLLTGAPGKETSPAFSPDGRSIAYAWDGGRGGKRDIWIKRLDSTDPQRLTSNPEDEWDPCWMPGGAAIAFLRVAPGSYQVVTVPVAGGPEHFVTRITDGQPWMEHRLACGLASGQLVIADGHATQLGLFSISTSTGDRQTLSNSPETNADFWPRVSPDGRQIAFVRAGSGFDVRVLELPRGTSRHLVKVAELKGLAWTHDGKSILYQTGAADPKNIWQISASGGKPHRPRFLTEANAEEITFSPGGSKIAYSRGTLDVNLWRVFRDGRPPAELAPSTRIDEDGAWSPDGTRFAFSSDRAGPSEIWIASAAGTNARRLTNLNGHSGSPAWSPDGRSVAFDVSGEGAVQIGVVSAAGGPARLLAPEGPVSLVPSWSHDGNWIYFCSNRSGTYEIWKKPSSGGTAVQITHHGGFESRESLDGRFLYYSKQGGDGIWRLPASGDGVEEKVADLDHTTQFRCWDLGAEGVYLASPGQIPRIDLLPTAGGRRQVAALPAELPKYARCLAVHPDGQSFLYPVREPDRWEIYLADNPARK